MKKPTKGALDERRKREALPKPVLPLWPKGEPIPAFESEEDECRFYRSYDFSELFEATPGSETRNATTPMSVRFDAEERRRLDAQAQRDGTSAAAVLRRFVRTLPHPRKAPKRRQGRATGA